LPAAKRLSRYAALLLVFGAVPLGAQPAPVDEGFNHFYNLEYDQAIASFEKAIAQNPNIPDYHNHLAQSLIFREMFRDGALESELVSGNNSFLRRAKLNPSPEVEKRILDEITKAMDLCNARLKTNPNDTAAMYALGISYGLRANYYWVVKKAWHDSLKDATSARKLHNRISALEPNNVDARLVQGLHDYIVGSLPWHWRTLGFLIGIHGDKEKGIRTVQEVAKNGKLNRLDAEVFLCALYRRENEPKQAIPLIKDLIHRYPRNFLLWLELAQMYSQEGDGKAGLDTLQEVARLKQTHSPGFDHLPWERIYYQQGSIQFWYRDFDSSIDNLKKVAAHPDEVDLNTGALAFLRMGQAYDMKHRRSDALDAYRRAIAHAPQSDAATEARKYLSSPYKR
jgi:tetratricopeptide (TPR) repeat protein